MANPRRATTNHHRTSLPSASSHPANSCCSRRSPACQDKHAGYASSWDPDQVQDTKPSESHFQRRECFSNSCHEGELVVYHSGNDLKCKQLDRGRGFIFSCAHWAQHLYQKFLPLVFCSCCLKSRIFPADIFGPRLLANLR